IHTIMGDILVRNIGATEQIRSENFKAVMVFFETYFPKWHQNHQLHQNSSEAEWILKNLPLMKESQYANIKTQNYLLYDRNKTNNNKKGELSE
ncbi:MAG: hypothetical protein ACRC1D_10450, partial [Culicoidibacterales bacterium]